MLFGYGCYEELEEISNPYLKRCGYRLVFIICNNDATMVTPVCRLLCKGWHIYYVKLDWMSGWGRTRKMALCGVAVYRYGSNMSNLRSFIGVGLCCLLPGNVVHVGPVQVRHPE